MEQKAKRIGKFNIIDIIAVILILAVLAFVGWKLMNRGGGADGWDCWCGTASPGSAR